MRVLVTAAELAALRDAAAGDKRLAKLVAKCERAEEREKRKGTGGGLSPVRFLELVRGVLGTRLGVGSSPDYGAIGARLAGKGLSEADVILSVTRMRTAWRGPIQLSSVLNNLEKFLAEDDTPTTDNGPLLI